MEEKFQNLLLAIRNYNPQVDTGKISQAWELCQLAHSEQKRLSGEPFATHPLEVANKLAAWHMDTTTIIAALLHDTIEDGGAKREDIVCEFGVGVARLVDGVTKVTELRLVGSHEQEFVENLRKMILAMAKDLRVVFLKLADRLHNMETLSYLPPEKQIINAKETLEVYVPLAERLGMGRVRGTLEDLAFPFVYRDDYEKLTEISRPFFKKAEKHIAEMKKKLLLETVKEGFTPEIHGRKKHLFSLWLKLQRPEIDWDFAKIYDIVALRIICGTVAQCYTALGIVHGFYKPVPSLGVSDFIAQPKPNGYRSIHTRVFGPEGRIVEVQIRTFLMHEEAEFGAAAHWAYSESKALGASGKVLEEGSATKSASKLPWVKQLLEWQKEISDSEEFLKAVKFEALRHRDFVFSPQGDVYDLPSGATPVDFAYAVHTGLGNFIAGAKVDGKIVPLDYKLKSGQMVEIIKSKNAKGPSAKWLDFVITRLAASEINKHLRKTGDSG